MKCNRCRGSMLRDGRDLLCILCGYSPSNTAPLPLASDAPKRRREPTMPTRINLRRQPQIGIEELAKVKLR